MPKIITISGLVCPVCGRPEINEEDSTKVNIRAFKVLSGKYWWSNCLVCDLWFNEIGKIEYPEEN